MHGNLMHGFDLLTAHVHDISVSALAAAVLMLGAVLLLELRTVVQLRHVMDNNLGRVFEQLDLLRFETHQLLEGQQSADTRRAPEAAAVIGNATGLAASASSPSTTLPQDATRVATAVATAAARPPVTLTTGEARLLSSLAQARARRVEAASA